MAEIRDYDVTAANNNSSPPDGAPEGQLPSTVNDTIREIMARLKREWSDRSGVNTTAGTSNAYTLAASQTITAYAAGDVFMFIADRANTGAATLAVDGLAAKSLVSNAQTALVANQIVANGIYVAAYDATNDTFQVMGVTDTGGALTLTSLSTDTINEKTAAAGVTVDGVLLKDGGAVFADGATIEVDTVNEATAAAGVTVDGVLLKDGGVTATAASSIAASSGTALRVTNTGSGDSLLIEDSANPDSTPFVITSNGTVGLGTTAPSLPNGVGPIVVSEASAAYGPQSAWRNTASDATAGYFHFEKSRSGGLVSASDVVGTLSWRAHDGVDFRGVATISALTGATPAAGDTPGILYFATTAEGATSSTERMRIDSAGNVGIGVTPTAKLHVTNTGSVNSLLVEDSTNPDSSPFVIDNDGRIIQGHTASLAGASPASFEQHSTSNYSTVGAPNVSVANWSTNGGFAGGLTFDRSLSGTVGTETTVVNGTDLGSIYWRGTDGSGFLQAAEILGEMDATPAGSGVDMPGRLSFRTTAVGSASPTERMRIDRDGDVGIGTGDPDGKLHVHSATAGTLTASNDADELVLENSGSCGISLLAPDAQNTNLYFGSPTDNVGAYLRWNHDANLLKVSTDKAGAELAFQTGAAAEAMRIDSAGLVGVGTATPTEKLDVNGDAIRVRTSQTPASASAAGDAGQICWDANYIYVCTATNTWKRSALATW